MNGKLILLLIILGMMVTSCDKSLETGKDQGLLPIPDKLVVLTFDDRAKSWIDFVAPLLKDYGFGATFYVTDTDADWFGYHEDPEYWISWDDVRKLSNMGFEIGNHSATHGDLPNMTPEEIIANELVPIERNCKKYGIPKPVSCAYPGGFHNINCVEALDKHGYLFGRRGVGPEYPGSFYNFTGPVYDPQLDHPLLVPAAYVWGSAFSSDSTSAREIFGRGYEHGATLADFARSVNRAKDGKIAVIVFHGVPDYYAHANTTPEDFTKCMNYLRDEGFKVIALRDLVKYARLTLMSQLESVLSEWPLH